MSPGPGWNHTGRQLGSAWLCHCFACPRSSGLFTFTASQLYNSTTCTMILGLNSHSLVQEHVMTSVPRLYSLMPLPVSAIKAPGHVTTTYHLPRGPWTYQIQRFVLGTHPDSASLVYSAPKTGLRSTQMWSVTLRVERPHSSSEH